MFGCPPNVQNLSIQSIFSNLVGNEEAGKIQVIANNVEVQPDGHFKIVYRHPESSVPSFPFVYLRLIPL